MKNYDIVIVTEQRYKEDSYSDDYSNTVVLEDKLLQTELEGLGLKVSKKAWDDSKFDWASTHAVVIRSTWDYFDRYHEFEKWLEYVDSKTMLINPYNTLFQNASKSYLLDLQYKGIRIPPTRLYRKGETRSLTQLFHERIWIKAIMKPVVGGAGRHTYLIDANNVREYEEIFEKLIAKESMLLQEYQESIVTKGEVSHMVFGGEYSHSVLKKAKQNDFRVQDDFGGSVHEYEASEDEIAYAENVVKHWQPLPVYARVDVMWDNEGKLALSELELIEPELWFRKNNKAANKLANFIAIEMKKNLELSNKY